MPHELRCCIRDALCSDAQYTPTPDWKTHTSERSRSADGSTCPSLRCSYPLAGCHKDHRCNHATCNPTRRDLHDAAVQHVVALRCRSMARTLDTLAATVASCTALQQGALCCNSLATWGTVLQHETLCYTMVHSVAKMVRSVATSNLALHTVMARCRCTTRTHAGDAGSS
jgi:hypothetical protein